MKGLLKFANKLFGKKESGVYRYEIQSIDTNGRPDFAWIDQNGHWITDDHRGSHLPTNAKREYSDSAYEFQRKQLESGNEKPWDTQSYVFPEK